MDKEDEDYKDLIDLRARVINDFKKYMKIVQNYEKNFDFEQYMKNSEYYNKTVMVDKHTMKYTGALIKDLIKVMK
jgi:biotin-(acetyl-CoA carboxylase) ligase